MIKCKDIKTLDKSKKIYYLLLNVIAIIYFFMIGENGVVLTKDSPGYIGLQGSLPAGYIIYPAFVRFLISIFGEKLGLTSMWVVQSLLAYITAVYVTEWIRKRFNLSCSLSLMIFSLSILQYAYTLPEYVATHEIMTEGLAIPLFNIIFILLLKWRLDRENKILFLISTLLIVLVFIRPQLLTICVAVLCVFVLEILLSWLNRKNSLKKNLTYIAIIIVLIVMASNIRPTMMYIMKIMPQFSHAVSGKVLLTIESDDRYYFTDIEQEAFDYVYNEVDEEKNRMVYMRKGVFRGDDIMTAVNHNTKYHLTYFNDYCERKEAELQIEISENDIKNGVLNTLFVKNFDRYVSLTCQLLPYSFVASIFIQPEAIKELCYITTALLYAFSFVFWLIARKQKIKPVYTKPFEITMVILVMNTLLTNVVFYAQQRYVIYTFGWYYVSVLLLIYGLIDVKSNKTEGV